MGGSVCATLLVLIRSSKGVVKAAILPVRFSTLLVTELGSVVIPVYFICGARRSSQGPLAVASVFMYLSMVDLTIPLTI